MNTEFRSEALGPRAFDVLRVDQVAKLLGCAETTVEERARSGYLPGLKFGDSGWVFPAAALLQRLNELALARTTMPNPMRVPSGIPDNPTPIAQVPLTDARGNWFADRLTRARG